MVPFASRLPAWPGRRPRLLFVLAVSVVLLLVAGTTASMLWRLRADTIERQQAVATLMTRAMEDYLSQSLNVVERTLTLAGSDPQIDQRMRFYLQQAPYLRSIALATPDGAIFSSANLTNIGITERRGDYMPHSAEPVTVLRVAPLAAGRDFADRRLAMHLDVRDLNFIPLALDVQQADGRWLTVLAALNSSYLQDYFSEHLPVVEGSVSLLRYDGRPLVSTGEGAMVETFSPALRRALSQRETGQYLDILPDGRRIQTAYRATRNYPFLLVVRLDEQRALARWQQEARDVASVVGLSMLGLLLVATVYFLRFERLSRIREQDAANLRIAAVAFESQEGMFVTDRQGVILRVNQAFTGITGFSATEAVGQTPKLFSSGRHDAAFYAGMWQTLRTEGAWRGEVWNRRKNGEVYPEWLSVTGVTDAAGQISHYVATLTDITQRKLAEEEIRQLAFFDPLTGLPNRRLLRERLQIAMEGGAWHGGYGALLFIDLDHFKTLNDTLGHDKGDLLLQQVAARLQACVGEGDTVSRQGGDEFVVLLLGAGRQRQHGAALAQQLAETIRRELGLPYDLAGHAYTTTPSIGVALFGDGPRQADELLKRADLALYSAKNAGRNMVCFFDPQMQASVSERSKLEAALRLALTRDDQLQLYYQPQVGASGKIAGAEVLLRWQHPAWGMIPPDRFIGLAEETGLILPLGNWVLDQACRQLARWAQHGATAGLTLSVNVSARQLQQPDFPLQVLSILSATGAPPQRLTLELTESMLVDDVDAICSKMLQLREHGVRFALDDFGTGYSSLAYLKRLPLDQLKIDQSFVRGVLDNSNDAAIVEMILALANTLGLTVLAEGVETAGQRDYLAQLGCRYYQGYWFGRPQPLAALSALLTSGNAAVMA